MGKENKRENIESNKIEKNNKNGEKFLFPQKQISNSTFPSALVKTESRKLENRMDLLTSLLNLK